MHYYRVMGRVPGTWRLAWLRLPDLLLGRDSPPPTESFICNCAPVLGRIVSFGMIPVRCCSVLQCVAVCCSVLQCVAVCCIVMQCVAYIPILRKLWRHKPNDVSRLITRYIAVCCSVLQTYRSLGSCGAIKPTISASSSPNLPNDPPIAKPSKGNDVR